MTRPTRKNNKATQRPITNMDTKTTAKLVHPQQAPITINFGGVSFILPKDTNRDHLAPYVGQDVVFTCYLDKFPGEVNNKNHKEKGVFANIKVKMLDGEHQPKKNPLNHSHMLYDPYQIEDVEHLTRGDKLEISAKVISYTRSDGSKAYKLGGFKTYAVVAFGVGYRCYKTRYEDGGVVANDKGIFYDI